MMRTTRSSQRALKGKRAPAKPTPRKKKVVKETGLVRVRLHRKDAITGAKYTNELVCQQTDTMYDFHQGMVHTYSGMKNKGTAVAYSQNNIGLGLGCILGDLRIVRGTANISCKLNECHDPDDGGRKAGGYDEVNDEVTTGALRLLFI